MHQPTLWLGMFDGLGIKADLWESTGIEDLGAEHSHLNLGAVIRGGVGIDDTKALCIYGNVNFGRIRLGDPATFYGSPNFVIVCEAAKETGLKDADRYCGLLSVNLLVRGHR